MGKGFGSGTLKKGKQSRTAYRDFLLQILQVTQDSKGDRRVVYPLLRANLGKLDENLAEILCNEAMTRLSEVKSEQAQTIAGDINNFSILIGNFPLGSRATNLEIAITGYKIAATVFTRSAFPQDWAMTQNNLGNAYCQRICGDQAKNLETAIAAYKAALQVCTREEFPEDWAETQSNLGTAYLYRIRGNQAENLEIGIALYTDALQVYSLEMFPEQWARTQNNLGTAYRSRIHGDRAENIETAIAAHKQALQVYTPEEFPQDWAGTQSNLGSAYTDRIQGDRAENLEKAIYCYQSALQFSIDKVLPKEWAMIQNNLAAAYCKRIQGDRTKNLEAAIAAHQASLRVYTRSAFPQHWAMVQNNLGNTYHERGQIAEAIAAYKFALKVYTRSAFPQYWAMTQNNLGFAYVSRGQIKEAIDCFWSALEIYTPTAFPVECLRSGNNLGNTAFLARRWAEAIEGYRFAIEAVEMSRNWVTSESRRQEILAEAIDVYEKMVQACINAGQLEKAIEYVERSRSKRLVDLMASYNLNKDGEISLKEKELLEQFNDLQERIDNERVQNNFGNNRELVGVGSRTSDRATFQAYNEAIAALEAEKLQIWEQLRSRDPVLAGEIKVDAPDFSTIQQQLIDQPTTAILSFYTTSNNTYIFILRKHQITLHTCAGEGFEALQLWLRDNWLSPYLKYSEANAAYRKAARDYTQAEKEAKTEQEQQALKDKENAKKELKEKRNELEEIWHRAIERVLQELSQKFQLSELITQHLNDVKELILVPHLLLHQIPFAALPVPHPEYRYLGDKFLIRYTPSCQVLEFCKQRGEVTENLTYGTVEDATNDLPFASFEGEQIAQLHQILSHRRLRGSSQATRDNYRKLAEQIQVLHSCHHAESCLDAPLNSQLKLGDGSITLGQLMSPGWRLPNLSDVFLSCCETGLGLPEITDDILTLSTGFLCAGARSVVSTLWAVNDLATAIFSIFYYQHRQQGCSRPEAVRQAQIKLRELNKEELLNREDIKELSRQAEAGRKEARHKRSKYEPGSADYWKWNREYQKYASVTNQIHSVKNSQDEEPFSHPRYWAAFICSGLR